jgi:hypothetical protein
MRELELRGRNSTRDMGVAPASCCGGNGDVSTVCLVESHSFSSPNPPGQAFFMWQVNLPFVAAGLSMTGEGARAHRGAGAPDREGSPAQGPHPSPLLMSCTPPVFRHATGRRPLALILIVAIILATPASAAQGRGFWGHTWFCHTRAGRKEPHLVMPHHRVRASFRIPAFIRIYSYTPFLVVRFACAKQGR